jgi:uncharacterized protein involved in outer membrane biogenesis
MRKLLRITVWVLAIFLVLMAGMFLYLRQADLSVYEEQIEGFLSDAIGHKLDVDGLFVLRFGRHTHLTAEDIRLSNPGWATDPVIASVGHLSVTVDIWSVISGPIIIEELDIREVRIRLENDGAGQANWATGRVRDESEPKKQFDRELIVFWDAQVLDVRFMYLDPARRRPLDIGLEKMTVIPDENHILDLDLTAVVNEIPVWADGKLGPWENLIDGNNIIADLDMTLGQVRIALDGSVDNLPKLVGTELSLSVSGPAIERITDRLGLPPFAEGAFEIDGGIVKLDVGSQLRLDGNLGAIELFASGTANNLLELDTAELDFSFSGPDTQYVAEVFGIKGAPAVPFRVTGDLAKEDTRLTFSETRAQLGENTLGFDGWLDFRGGIPDGDITLNASGPNFSVVGPFARVPNMPAEEFEISGRIQKTGKSARFDDVKAIVGENRISANGAIGQKGGPDTQISFNASGPDISILGPMAGLEGIQPRAFDISAVIKPDSAGIRLENAEGDFGEIQLAADGVVGIGRGMAGTDLKLSAAGTDLREIALLTGVPMLPDGPFDVSVRARFENEQLRLSEGTASVAEMNGAISGFVLLGANVGDFDFDLSVNGPDLADALQFQWLERMSGEAFSVNGNLSRQAGEFELTSVSMSISDFEIGVDGRFAIDDATGDVKLRATAPDAEELRKLIDIGYLPEGPVSVSGRVEKQAGELEFSKVVANIGEYTVGIDGTLSNAPLSNRSDLRFSGAGPELSDVGLIFDYDDLPAKTFSFSGEVNGIPTGFAVENFVARIGENNIDGAFTADLRDKPEIAGSLTSSYVDLARRLQASEDETAEPEEVTSDFVFSDEPLNTEWMEAANIDITVRTDRLILGFGDVSDYHVRVRLWDGVLDINPISFRELEGNVSASVHLGPANGALDLDVSLMVENMHLGLLGAADQERSTVPPIDGQFTLSGSGNTLHGIMASSNGRLHITQGSGRLKDLMTSRLFGDMVLQIIRTLNPLQKEAKYTTLQCAYYVIDVVDGLATIGNFAIQTDRMATIAKGSINFRDEKLNLTMRVAPREGLGISIGGVANSFFKLGGTLQNPKLQLDPTASVATTGAAVATGGISLLAKGLWDRVKAQSDICEEMAKENDEK